MRRYVTMVAIAIVLAASAAMAAGDTSAPDLIARGKLLVSFGGCGDCHTPKNMTPQGPVPDMTRALSGHPAGQPMPPVDKQALTPGYWVLMAPDLQAFVGPWGVSYPANLTPDDQTGLGLWTEDIFVKTVRTGKHMGTGRPLLPPMFVQNLQTLSDDDLRAIFAYLKSLPPIKNQVPAPVAPPDVK
ncbi:MAG TPA: hypothetical protein VFH88_06410 [Candidatus Krumholzibacteria bacterium]|nr:hypothetical protein [Candidatus Krumholzibacteria bacterium]